MARYDQLPPKPLPSFDWEKDTMRQMKRDEDRALMEAHGPIRPDSSGRLLKREAPELRRLPPKRPIRGRNLRRA